MLSDTVLDVGGYWPVSPDFFWVWEHRWIVGSAYEGKEDFVSWLDVNFFAVVVDCCR